MYPGFHKENIIFKTTNKICEASLVTKALFSKQSTVEWYTVKIKFDKHTDAAQISIREL